MAIIIKLHCSLTNDSLAEWSKAPDLGSGPKGRGFKSHSCHFSHLILFFFNVVLSLSFLSSKSILVLKTFLRLDPSFPFRLILAFLIKREKKRISS